ncbi:MerR family transcriptional regulator [Buchananella hordeovulneris]|uniref:MerR family transcriptional regulator n=1 Tax=Buchananella hordeovulneris TaxID=52770 RepID=UPI000F5EC2E7|nr:MerR family transcriptional regulator [Buchananella hordeovulneris]RRD52720.1 MerR family transcriptional regulator [Buchananella hordeovulneris]
MTETPNLLPIGQFSALTRLSVRMLRHYDAHGVLVPAAVDPHTGYRRYAPAQLETAAAIRNLRDVGFGVSAISALLTTRGTDNWARALELQRKTLLKEEADVRRKLRLLHQLLDGGKTMSITVSRATVPAMTVVALTGTVPTYSDEGQLWEVMLPQLISQGIQATGPAGVIEHGEEYVEHNPRLSIFVPVAAGTTTVAPLQVLELPERECVVAEVVGPYTQITDAHDQIAARLATDGLRRASGDTLAAKAFNFYLNDPREVPEEQLRTLVHLPIN